MKADETGGYLVPASMVKMFADHAMRESWPSNDDW